jgi:L-ascorbate metabolism protein UlaG (beta-lactamase superfamily)
MRITYIGHATLLIEAAGRRVLTDPNFDETYGRFLPRATRPGIALGELPKLDALLLTHAHADHLSFESLNQLPRDIPLFAPPAVERWLRKLGYTHAEPLAPAESAEVGGITIHAASAKHLGARYGYDRWRSAANMYLLDAEGMSTFFAGDTGLSDDVHRLVEERVWGSSRTLDVALLPIGHAPWWKPRFRTGHLTSEDALTLFERLKARHFIPYHWGTFHHFTAGAHDAIEQLRDLLTRHHRRQDVAILEPGQAFQVRKHEGVTPAAPAVVPVTGERE